MKTKKTPQKKASFFLGCFSLFPGCQAFGERQEAALPAESTAVFAVFSPSGNCLSVRNLQFEAGAGGNAPDEGAGGRNPATFPFAPSGKCLLGKSPRPKMDLGMEHMAQGNGGCRGPCFLLRGAGNCKVCAGMEQMIWFAMHYRGIIARKKRCRPFC